MMNSILKVNELFINLKDDLPKFSIILAFSLFRGQTRAFVSDLTKQKLNAFTSDNKNDLLKALVSYAFAVTVLSPLEVIFNEFVRILRVSWSKKLTTALARKMLARKIRDEEEDKNFETIVSSEADRFVELEIDLAIELLEAVTHLYFFTRILWKISPKLGSAGLATAVFGTASSLILGRARLAKLFREEREASAIFSHNLSRCRENLESIQFANAYSLELSRIERFDDNRQRMVNSRKREKDVVRLFSTLLRQLAGGLFPSIILKYHQQNESRDHAHQHQHQHGHSHHHSHQLETNKTHAGHPQSLKNDSPSNIVAELAQSSEAFDEILYHLLIVSENFHDVVRLATIGQDIAEILSDGHLENLDTHITKIENIAPSDPWLRVDHLCVRVPPNLEVKLVEEFNVTLNYGDSLLLTGSSGSGKTALLRALYGIWPVFKGRVTRPSDTKLIVLPQKPFCPLGTLKEQVTYPNDPGLYSDESVKDALLQVGLKNLAVSPLNEVRKWSDELSVGEQQRLGFSRVVLQKPLFAFFDESSSSLDLENETRMYELISSIVVGGYVSIGHRKSIEKYHLKKIHLFGASEQGQWKSIF